VKSRRGAPKRIQTEGFACPNHQCLYCGITDAHIHALVGDGKHGHAERIQTLRGPACRTTFSARRHTPLYRLKTPSHQIALVRISPEPVGWTHRRPRRSSAPDKPPSRAFLSRAGSHAQTFHERFFRNLWLPHLQLDELRTRLRCAKQVRLALAGHRPLHARFFLCSSWVGALNTWRTWLFTSCDRPWHLAASRSSPVMASIAPFMLSRPILDSGST
jgi:hypothetical protein